MEREHQAWDPRLARAARSLYINRRNREIADQRIARASRELMTYLGLNGVCAATLGVFDVALVNGELEIVKRAVADARQLHLPEPAAIVAVDASELAERGAGPVERYDEQSAAPDLFAAGDAEMLMLLRRFVGDLSRQYEGRTERPAEATVTIGSPADAYRFLEPEMAHLPQEQLRVLNLNIKNRILSAPMIYQGTVCSTHVRAAEVFRPAVLENAYGIIVAHNHPSGIPDPSAEDIQLTRQLVELGKLMDIQVLDHIIVARSGFTSLREQGLGFS